MKERVVMNLQARQLLGHGDQRGGGIPILRGSDIRSLLDVVLRMEAGSIGMQPGLGRGENSMFNVECEGLVGEPYGIAQEDTENVKQEYYEGLT